MRKLKKRKMSLWIVFVISGLAAEMLSILSVWMFSVYAAKRDPDFDNYIFYLFGSAFVGSFFSSFAVAKTFKTRRFVIALLFGFAVSLLFTLIIIMMNRFSVSAEILFVPAVGITGGFTAGLITKNIR